MKLPNGYGSITKLTGKRRKPWVVRAPARYSIDDDIFTEKRQILGYYATKAQALEALTEYNENPFDLSTQGLTFADIYSNWSAIKFPKVSKQSAASYTASYKKCIALYDMPFSDIRLSHLQALMDTMCDKSKSTANNLKILFNTLFDYAVKHDIVARDYSKYVELVYKDSGESIHKVISESEIEQLWGTSDNDTAALTLILIYSGWRISELLNLERIDLTDMIMQGGMKTEAGKHRIVPIHSRIQPLVKRLYHDGILYDGNYFRFKADFKARLGDHQIHDTRYTFVSRLQTAGADHICIERLTGHSSTGVTDRVYTHKPIDELRKAIELLA